jgi:hypothetical protein
MIPFPLEIHFLSLNKNSGMRFMDIFCLKKKIVMKFVFKDKIRILEKKKSRWGGGRGK